MKETKYTYNDEKENAIFAVKLRGLFDSNGATHKNLADYIEKVTGETVTRQAIGQWCNGHTCPNLKTVPVIAEFFNVSTDYLLTDTNIKTANTGLRAACEYTWLSEKAAERLHSNKSVYPIVSHFISSNVFWEIVHSMRKLNIKSNRVMDWNMILKKYEIVPQLVDMLNITSSQAEEIVTSYVYDKYIYCKYGEVKNINNMYGIPKDHPNDYVPLAVVHEDTECDIFRYKLIQFAEKISNLFDHREDFFKFTREELMEYLHITKEELKTLQEEAKKYHSMADQDASFDDMDTEEIMDDWFYESRTRHLQEEEAKEEQNNGEHNSTQE